MDAVAAVECYAFTGNVVRSQGGSTADTNVPIERRVIELACAGDAVSTPPGAAIHAEVVKTAHAPSLPKLVCNEQSAWES